GLKAGSVTGTDTLFTNNRYASYYGIDGYLDDTSSFSAANIYLKNAYQRISYSLHQQVGIIASYNQKVGDMLNLTFGGELRSWSADHPGHFTNLFGKKSLTAQTYGFTDTLGLVKSFNRTVYEGDLDGPTSDWGFPSGWKLADSKDPQFRTQYRNYKGETPQYTIFAQGNWKHEDLNIMGSLQYVWYKYKLTEYMPSENAVGRQLKASERTALGLIDSSYEGPRNGKFYMMNPDKKNWYEFELVNAERSRGFIQPKVGFNYNMTKNLNMFANFAHVERFVDLGIYYNQGRVYPEAEDEKSNQFEFGTGWVSESFNAKVNTYYMLWENKSARIQDVTKSGQPGYDRNGFRTELVGTSRNIGLEFEFAADLNKFLPIKGFGLRGSITMMDNRWTKVLDSVMVDKKNLGQLQEDINMNGVLDPGEDVNGNNALNDNRRVFNTSALNIDGKKDVVYFAELADKHVASGPQLMGSIGLTFDYEEFFAAVDMNYYAKNYLLDGDSYMQVDGEWTNTGIATGFLAPYDTKQVFTSKYDNKFPGVAIFEVSAGYNINYWLLKGFVSIQVGNIFNTKYF
ncbi:MAG: TonB-dependent receptor, partial [Bacteroidetes bacterium]